MDIISITLVVVDFDQEEADPVFICVPALVIISYRTELVYPAEECYYYFSSFIIWSDLRQITLLFFACLEIYSTSLVSSWIEVLLQQFESYTLLDNSTRLSHTLFFGLS